MTIDLTDKVALVTGGSRGIGQATAVALARAGAKVALVARTPDRAQSAAAAIGGEALGITADVADAGQVDGAVSEAETRLGPVDILVNNAGVTRDGLLARMGEEDWGAVMDVNLTGTFHTTKRVCRSMMKRRSGRVINITSVVGITGNKGQANYAASKAGLIGFTKSVAKELGSRNVLVNAIAPGFVETDMTRALNDDQRRALLAQIPLNRLGTSDEVANMVLFLSSNLSSYITGQVFVVDGGMVM